MIRTQIQLEPDQYEHLKALAARRATSVAQLIRDGVDHVLASEDTGAGWERFLKAAGTFRSPDGALDVARQHDDHLPEAFS